MDGVKKLEVALKQIRVEARKSKPDPDKIWRIADEALKSTT